MLNIIPIPAFQDNYIWLIEDGTHAAVVDPGDAVPVIAAVEARGLKLSSILITHHHADHIGGVEALMREYSPEVFAPAKERYAFDHTPVNDGQTIYIEDLNLTLGVMDVGGHTLDHVAYYGANSLFCGDTLFGAGCGRLFEGTPAQMYASLEKIATLPDETAVYCAHEYTEHNLQFAKRVEAHNPDVAARINSTRTLRSEGRPSLPSTIGLERATNPFLRCTSTDIMTHLGLSSASPVEVFTELRARRNLF